MKIDLLIARKFYSNGDSNSLCTLSGDINVKYPLVRSSLNSEKVLPCSHNLSSGQEPSILVS